METEWMYIIRESQNNYYCVICGYDISGHTNAGLHVIGNHHSNALSEYGRDLAYNGNHYYYCHLCRCNIFGYLNVRCHLKGRRHQDNLYFGPDSDMDYEDDYYSDSNSDSDDYDSDDYYY